MRTAATEAISAAPTLRVEGERVSAPGQTNMPSADKPPRSPVKLDRDRVLATRRKVPLTVERPFGLKAPVEAGGGERPNVSDIVKAVPTAHLARSPFGLAYPPLVVECHLCSVYQVSGFAAILHKRDWGALPPPNVKGRFAFPLDILPPAFATWQGLGEAQTCTERKIR